MKTQKKSIIAFAVFAASAIVAVGAPLAQSTFASQSNVCTLNPSTGAVTTDKNGAATDCHLTNQVQVNVGEVLTIDVAQDLIELDPIMGQTKGGITDGDTGNTDVTVATNWTYGASLSVSMNTDVVNLVGESKGGTITPTADATLSAVNTWGYYAYNKSGSAPTTPSWSAMKTKTSSGDVIFNGSTTGDGMSTAGSTTWNFVYGATIDYSTPADAYTGTILYTAAVNSID